MASSLVVRGTVYVWRRRGKPGVRCQKANVKSQKWGGLVRGCDRHDDGREWWNLMAKGGLVRKLLGVIVIGVAAASGVVAQEKGGAAASTAPATTRRATTGPAAVDDATKASVLAATSAYFEAWLVGDAKRVGQLLDPRNDAERNLAGALGRWVESAGTLRRAAAAKFGDKAAGEIATALPFPDPFTGATKMLDQIKRGGVDVVVRDDMAAVTRGPVGRIGLRKVLGQWKLTVAVPPEDKTGRDLAGAFERVAMVQEAVATGITSGKYPTAAAAREAFRKGEGLRE